MEGHGFVNCQDFLSTCIPFSIEMIYTENTGTYRVPNNPWPWCGLLLYTIQRQCLKTAHEWLNLKVGDRVSQVFEHSEVFDQSLFQAFFFLWMKGLFQHHYAKRAPGTLNVNYQRLFLLKVKQPECTIILQINENSGIEDLQTVK